MRTRASMWAIAGLLVTALAAAQSPAPSQGKADLKEIPAKVLDALKAKFAGAEIRKWTKETENGVVLYDFEFTQAGKKLEADIREDGTIHNWEKEIATKDLPAAVKTAVEKKYQGATLKESMQVTAVKDGKDVLEGFEVLVAMAGDKTVEVMVAPDGKIIEESQDDDSEAESTEESPGTSTKEESTKETPEASDAGK